MRAALALAFILFAAPALAQYWTHYANARFGYEIDVPPGFEHGGESANGDGQAFYDLEAEQGLRVWGGYFLDGFEAEAATAVTQATEENWSITNQSMTPQWASFTAQRDHRIMVQRMVGLCDGASYAAFRLEFNMGDLGRMDAVIDGLARSFRPSSC